MPQHGYPVAVMELGLGVGLISTATHFTIHLHHFENCMLQLVNN